MACYLEGQLLAEPDSRIGVFQGATFKRCRAPKKGLDAVVLMATMEIPRMGGTQSNESTREPALIRVGGPRCGHARGWTG